MQFYAGILVTTEAAHHYRKWGLETQHLTHATNIYEFESEMERDAFIKGFQAGMKPRSSGSPEKVFEDELERRSYEKGMKEGSGQEDFWLLTPDDLEIFMDDVGL